MEHNEALPLVSEMFDARNVSPEAARHIQSCPICRERLRDYDEMKIELRLAASAADSESPEPQLTLPNRTRLSRWTQGWRTGVSIPKPAFALGIVLIVALSVGLGYVRAQGSRQIFHFEVDSPQAEGRWGAELQAGGKAIYGMPAPRGNVRVMFQLLGIRDGVAHLSVHARLFNGNPSLTELRALGNVPAREYQYTPGEILEIPINDWGTLSLKGELLDHAEKFPWYNSSVEPSPNQIVLNAPVLLKDKGLVFQDAGSRSATGPNPSVSFYVPGQGRFIIRLQSFEGAVRASADFSQVSFDLDGDEYLLACATSVTGGPQPRQIWIYLDRNGEPDSPY